MKLNFKKMMYVKVLMMVIAIWFVPMTYSNGAKAPAGDVAEAPGADAFNNDRYDARSTFYGDIHGGDTLKKKEEEKMTTQNKEMEVVKDLDLERYMGRWYEIASLPSIFQPKNGIDTRATYTLNPDGTVDVLNETWNSGKRVFIQGSAYKTDPKSDEAKFKVKFYVPPFLPIIPVTGDYWVLYIDPEYQHAVIGQPSRSYLWILSRTAHVEEETYKQLLEKAVEEGYDVSKLHKTPQSDTPPESNAAPNDTKDQMLK
ncbi:unnamed protein product [Brassica rapa subsp. trilocularis]